MTSKPRFVDLEREKPESICLSCILTEYKEKNVGNAYPPVAVGKYGIRRREDIYSKALAKDYSKNKLIRKNTLTTGMGSNQIDIGVLSEDEVWSVSPAYHTFQIAGVDPDYLRHCLRQRNPDMFKRFAVKSCRQGKSLEIKRWLTYEIPVYSNEIQQVITANLDLILSQIAFTEEYLRKLDELVKSRFVEMFGSAQTGYKYDMRKLGDLLAVEPQNGMYKPQKYYVSDNGGTPIVRVDAFQAGYIEDYRTLKRLNCTSAEIETYGLANDDIVMNRVNGSIERVGKIAWINGLVEPTVFESNMMRFHVDESFLRLPYIVAFLNSADIRRQIRGCARIANQCSINQTNVMNLDIPIAPLELQEEFAAFVQQVDKLEFAAQQQIDKLQELYDSLAQEYFGQGGDDGSQKEG